MGAAELQRGQPVDGGEHHRVALMTLDVLLTGSGPAEKRVAVRDRAGEPLRRHATLPRQYQVGVRCEARLLEQLAQCRGAGVLARLDGPAGKAPAVWVDAGVAVAQLEQYPALRVKKHDHGDPEGVRGPIGKLAARQTRIHRAACLSLICFVAVNGAGCQSIRYGQPRDVSKTEGRFTVGGQPGIFVPGRRHVGRQDDRVRGMTDDMTIGQRVAFYRRRRGISQDVLAGLVGKTAEWLRKVENNRAELDRLSVIRDIASALDVALADLIGEPSLFDWSEGSGRQTIPALRAALRDYRHLTPAIASFDDDAPPSLADLEREIADIWDRYQRSQYATLARRLPYLIHDSLTATRAFDGNDGQRAQALTAYVHQVATLFLTKLGEADLAWIAASRGLAAANASNDHVVIGSLSRAAAHALISIGEYGQARGLASAAAQYLQPRLARPTPELLSVYGSLHLVCAMAAAHQDDRTTAHTHLGEASDSAGRLGGDANHLWTAFGPTNVAIHQVSVAMEFGDVARAIEIGPTVDTRALPIERRVRHSIEVARAFARWNRVDDALDALLSAEQIGPDQVRYHRLSRMIVREILSRSRTPRTAIELSTRMGVRSATPTW